MKRKMMKTLFAAAGVAVLLFGLGSCSSVTAHTTYALPLVKIPDFDAHPYGGFGLGASLDTTYTQVKFDYYPFVEAGPEEAQALNFSYGFFLKYPIELGKMTLSPMIGATVAAGGFEIGAGLDIPVGKDFFFRTEALYDFGPTGYTGEASTLVFRAGLGYKFDMGWGGALPSGGSASLVSDELVAKSSGLVFDAARSLGMTVEELRKYWSAAELIEFSDGELCAIIGYPSLVNVTQFFLTDGKVDFVSYSFGSYSVEGELALKLAFIQRFGKPAGTDGAKTYWVTGTTAFFLGKEENTDAESGYILTLVCFRPDPS
jgi:hypothetical protein